MIDILTIVEQEAVAARGKARAALWRAIRNCEQWTADDARAAVKLATEAGVDARWLKPLCNAVQRMGEAQRQRADYDKAFAAFQSAKGKADAAMMERAAKIAEIDRQIGELQQAANRAGEPLQTLGPVQAAAGEFRTFFAPLFDDSATWPTRPTHTDLLPRAVYVIVPSELLDQRTLCLPSLADPAVLAAEQAELERLAAEAQAAAAAEFHRGKKPAKMDVHRPRGREDLPTR